MIPESFNMQRGYFVSTALERLPASARGGHQPLISGEPA